MNLAMQRYEVWRVQPSLDETLAKELLAMEGDAEKITDSFGCDLAFGTAGLRGARRGHEPHKYLHRGKSHAGSGHMARRKQASPEGRDCL